MKLKITTILCILIGNIQAQNIAWQRVLHGENAFNPAMNNGCVAVDSSGYWASHLLKRKTSYGQVHLGTIKAVHFDAHGNADDSVLFEGKSHMIAMKAVKDRVFMWVGYFDSIKIGNSWHTLPGNYGTVLCYQDKSGLHNAGFMGDTIAALTLRKTGHVAMVTNSGFGGDVTLHEFTPLGGFASSKTLPGLGFVQGIEETSNGGLLITGSCMQSKVDIDSVHINNPFTYTNYVLYLDAQRVARWMRYIEDITCTASFAVGNGTNTYWSGTVYIQPDFDSLPYTGGPFTSFADFFATKISSEKFSWVREIPSDTTFAEAIPGKNISMGMDENQNVYMVGTVRGNPIHWNSSTKTGKKGNFNDIWIISWDSSGNLRWVQTYGGTGFDMGVSLEVKGEDDLIFNAVVSDTFELDGQIIPADYGDMWVVKVQPKNNGIRRAAAQTSFQLFPNPGSDLVAHNLMRETPFILYAISGVKVQEGRFIPGEPLQVKHIPDGVYFFKVPGAALQWIKSNEVK